MTGFESRMNNGLISREALKKSIEEYRSLNCVSTSTIIGVRNVVYLIDNAPTVETFTKDEYEGAYLRGYVDSAKANERPKGEWIIKPKENSQSAILICNRCNHFIPITVDKNFCPNCGAEMRGDDNGKQG